LKLAFAFPPRWLGNGPVDWNNFWDSPRGATGSELNCFCIALEMSRRGHEVVLFTECSMARGLWEGMIPVYPYESLENVSHEYAAVIMSLDPTDFPRLSDRPLRVLCQQLNDFAYCAPGFNRFVDLYLSPSEPHKKMLTDPSVRPELGKMGGWIQAHKVEVVPNGCYLTDYERVVQKVPGRCVYLSSPDRGLHLVLREWTKIRRAYPKAHLKIFYHSLGKWLEEYSGKTEGDMASVQEVWRKPIIRNMKNSQFVAKALPMFGMMGIEVVGATSRRRLAVELQQAEVVTYPCEVIMWTEGFSCATLEGCAAGALPILSDVDALGGIYGGAVPMVEAPASEHLAEWRGLVIRALTDKAWADEWRVKARALAEKHAWPDLAAKMERVVEERLCRK
jgi:glycosyltransferase involved in cell wall biosynthesis